MLPKPSIPSPRPGRGFYRGHHLPHYDLDGATQFVTFRLASSVPLKVIERWRDELGRLPMTADERAFELRRRIERWVDRAAAGPDFLDAKALCIVRETVLRFDGVRYDMLAWVLMPNHGHFVFTTRPGVRLGDLVGTWKAHSARLINRRRGCIGSLWEDDYWDTLIRDDDHLQAAIRYVEHNPVKAGLVTHPAEWMFSSAGERHVCRRPDSSREGRMPSPPHEGSPSHSVPNEGIHQEGPRWRATQPRLPGRRPIPAHVRA